MKYKSTRDGGIAEIHAHLHAMVGKTWPFPERNLDRVAQVLIRSGLSIDLEYLEVDLVYMESMSLERPIFNGPVFDCSNLGGDHGLLVVFENLLLLSIDGDVELDGTVGAAELLREIKFPQRGRVQST